jgi:hypothetical protein
VVEPFLVADVAHAQGGGWGPPGGYPPGSGYPPPPGGGYPPPPPGGFAPPPGGFAPAPPGKPITGSPQTMAIHAMTIDPATGLPRGEKPPATTAAVVSLVCGLLLCLGPLTGIPAIIAGFIARGAIKRDPASAGGGTMALAGIILGVLNVLGFVVWFVLGFLLALV